jgi:hypothetical protein
MATQTAKPNYDEANQPRRQPRAAAGSANLQAAFNDFLAANVAGAGGAAGGTARSAGSYTARNANPVRNRR